MMSITFTNLVCIISYVSKFLFLLERNKSSTETYKSRRLTRRLYRLKCRRYVRTILLVASRHIVRRSNTTVDPLNKEKNPDLFAHSLQTQFEIIA